MTDETRHNVRESADKYRAETTVKRGDGTRDEDRIKLKARGDDPRDVVQDLHTMIDEHTTLGTGENLRAYQPGDDDA